MGGGIGKARADVKRSRKIALRTDQIMPHVQLSDVRPSGSVSVSHLVSQSVFIEYSVPLGTSLYLQYLQPSDSQPCVSCARLNSELCGIDTYNRARSPTVKKTPYGYEPTFCRGECFAIQPVP